MVYRAQDNLLDDARAVVGEGSTADNPAHVEAKNPAVLVPEAVAGEAVIDPVVGWLATMASVLILVSPSWSLWLGPTDTMQCQRTSAPDQ